MDVKLNHRLLFFVIPETASDQSDIEVRIHALSEELKRRKAEAEKLKKEQKKKNRERLKEKELSLQKQLEVCVHLYLKFLLLIHLLIHAILTSGIWCFNFFKYLIEN